MIVVEKRSLIVDLLIASASAIIGGLVVSELRKSNDQRQEAHSDNH